MTDTDVLERSVHIDASPETVWHFWTDPRGLCTWWGVEAEAEARSGGIFRVVMDGGAVMLGEYLELDPPNRVLFSFGWEGEGPPAGPLPPGSTRVEVTLTAAATGGTDLVLRHFDLPAHHQPEHDNGWGHFLGVLVTVGGAA